VRIYHDREASLLENRCNSPHLSPREKEAAETALAEHRKTFVLGPRHTDVVRQLCHRYPLLSPTIRLLKKWFEAHMMTGHVPEELVELLAVRTFMYPFPYAQPASVMAGFLRSLQWLAKWDWRAEPLVLDFSAELKGEELARLRDGFEKARKKDPALHHSALWVASNQDQESLWTRGNRPAKVVAARLTALARAADAAVKTAGLALEPQRLFMPAPKEFDFVMQLSGKWLGGKKKKEKQEQQFKNLQLEEEEEGITAEEIAKLGFEPARDFIHEISVSPPRGKLKVTQILTAVESLPNVPGPFPLVHQRHCRRCVGTHQPKEMEGECGLLVVTDAQGG
jgi:U3 small nucleolar RNA-associated protein 22